MPRKIAKLNLIVSTLAHAANFDCAQFSLADLRVHLYNKWILQTSFGVSVAIRESSHKRIPFFSYGM